MRNDTYNPAQRIIEKAVAAGRVDRTKTPVAPDAVAVPFGGTTAGTNEDGTTYTIHTAITQLDSTGDPGAATGGW